MLYLPGAPGVYYNESLGLISATIDGENRITLADRDLGAEGVGLSGKLYQRGNNYGFSTDKTESTTSTKVDASSYGPDNYYSSDVWNTASGWESSGNTDLWGYTTGTDIAMRGPCPEGFHIMTVDDANLLLNILNPIYNASKTSDIRNLLKIVPRGYALYSSRNMSGTSYAYYRTPRRSSTNYAYYTRFYNNTISSSTMYTSYGMFIRPIKNEPIIPVETDWRQMVRIRTIDNGSIEVSPSDDTITCDTSLDVAVTPIPSDADVSWAIVDISHSHLNVSGSANEGFTLSPNYIRNGSHTFKVYDNVSRMEGTITYYQKCSLPSDLEIIKNITENDIKLLDDTTARILFNDNGYGDGVDVVITPEVSIILTNGATPDSPQNIVGYPGYNIYYYNQINNITSGTQIGDKIGTIEGTLKVTESDGTTVRSFPYSVDLCITGKFLTTTELGQLASSDAIVQELNSAADAYREIFRYTRNQMRETYEYGISLCCEVIVEEGTVFTKDGYCFVYDGRRIKYRLEKLTAYQLSQLATADDVISELNGGGDSRRIYDYQTKLYDEGSLVYASDYGCASVQYLIAVNNTPIIKEGYYIGYDGSMPIRRVVERALTYDELILLPDSTELGAHGNIETIINTINNYGAQNYFNFLQRAGNIQWVLRPSYEYYSGFALTDSNGNPYVVETGGGDYQTIVTFNASDYTAGLYTYHRTLSF